ncbi:MAG: DUF370 domain-containing protein [Oscillospiraceae bacterium]|jgi:hypothetical protein|nr:DUF370 domain-containing protein [Oscillospiraceae bacterium]
MYLHLGQNVVVPTGDIVGIFDLDNTTCSHATRDFLRQAEEAGRVVSVTDDVPRSFVVADGGGGQVYLTQLAAATLVKRGALIYR